MERWQLKAEILEIILLQLLHEMDERLTSKPCLLVAIDGRCAAGKTTLAAHLQRAYACNLFHMDDFFLRPQQRSEERFAAPGGNVDYERFSQEVMEPLLQTIPFSYQPYDCHAQALKAPIRVTPHPVNIVEGSYCCHPKLSSHYDLKVFLHVNRFEQLQRIERRNGSERVTGFIQKWIPLEEDYFKAYRIKEQSDLCFHLGGIHD